MFVFYVTFYRLVSAMRLIYFNVWSSENTNSAILDKPKSSQNENVGDRTFMFAFFSCKDFKHILSKAYACMVVNSLTTKKQTTIFFCKVSKNV